MLKGHIQIATGFLLVCDYVAADGQTVARYAAAARSPQPAAIWIERRAVTENKRVGVNMIFRLGTGDWALGTGENCTLSEYCIFYKMQAQNYKN